jgi:hypothetical protein
MGAKERSHSVLSARIIIACGFAVPHVRNMPRSFTSAVKAHSRHPFTKILRHHSRRDYLTACRSGCQLSAVETPMSMCWRPVRRSSGSGRGTTITGSAEDDRCGCEGDGSSRWYSRSGHGQPYQAHKTGQRPRTAQGPSALHRFGLGCGDRGRDCAIVSERRHRGHFRRRSFGRADLQPRLTRRRLPRPSNAVITRQRFFPSRDIPVPVDGGRGKLQRSLANRVGCTVGFQLVACLINSSRGNENPKCSFRQTCCPARMTA